MQNLCLSVKNSKCWHVDGHCHTLLLKFNTKPLKKVAELVNDIEIIWWNHYEILGAVCGYT